MVKVDAVGAGVAARDRRHDGRTDGIGCTIVFGTRIQCGVITTVASRASAGGAATHRAIRARTAACNGRHCAHGVATVVLPCACRLALNTRIRARAGIAVVARRAATASLAGLVVETVLYCPKKCANN